MKVILQNTITSLFAAYCAFVSSDELHKFSNGEVADADKINENFQLVLQKSSKGCSAIQERSSVIINCADGTAAVLAGVGTVVMYPQGQAGTVPDLTAIPSGEFVVIDASETILARYRSGSPSSDHWVVDLNSELPALTATLFNDSLTQSVVLTTDDRPSSTRKLAYLTEDCSGEGFADFPFGIYDMGDDGYFIASRGNSSGDTIFRSTRLAAYFDGKSLIPPGECVPAEFIGNINVAITYTPAPEIINATFPARLEQLQQ